MDQYTRKAIGVVVGVLAGTALFILVVVLWPLVMFIITVVLFVVFALTALVSAIANDLRLNAEIKRSSVPWSETTEEERYRRWSNYCERVSDSGMFTPVNYSKYDDRERAIEKHCGIYA